MIATGEDNPTGVSAQWAYVGEPVTVDTANTPLLGGSSPYAGTCLMICPCDDGEARDESAGQSARV